MWEGNVADDPLRERTDRVKCGSLSRASTMEGPRLPPAWTSTSMREKVQRVSCSTYTSDDDIIDFSV